MPRTTSRTEAARALLYAGLHKAQASKCCEVVCCDAGTLACLQLAHAHVRQYNNPAALHVITLTVTYADKQRQHSSYSVLPPTEELQQVYDKLSKTEQQALFSFSQDVLRKQALKDTKEVIANAKGDTSTDIYLHAASDIVLLNLTSPAD